MNPNRPRPPFRPIGDRVLVRRLDPDALSAGGLHIPERHRRKLNRGEVLALGPDVDDDGGALVEGVEALFGAYTGDDIELDGERLLVLRADELLGVFQAPDDDALLGQHECSPGDTWWEYDAQGIPLCLVCCACVGSKLARYRPEILAGYSQSDVDEPIEPEH
jgi:chaperonin GroES